MLSSSLPSSLALSGPSHRTALDADLIAGFYAAAAQAQDYSGPWSALCDAFKADTGLLYRQSRPTASPDILAAQNWSGSEQATPHAWADIRVPGLPNTAAPPSLAAFDASEQPPARALRVLRATVHLDGTALIGMGLHRADDAPAFDDADRRALDGLGRHVASALRLEAMLGAARNTSAIRAAALDLHPHGVVVSTGMGGLVFANRAAREIAEAGGLQLGVSRACLAGLRPSEAARLERLIVSVAAGGDGGCVRIDRGAGLPLVAAIVEALPVQMADLEPVAARRGAPSALVQISLRDLGATTDASPSALFDLFGLTPAEAGIVPQLLAGDSASLIAQSRGVAVSTVKAQCAKILVKTGAANLRALSMMIAMIS
jgi:DNA-binding NarL/FixJ family response regulator